MTQVFANFFRDGLLLFELAVVLLAALAPALLRARGAWLLWLSGAGIWLAASLAVLLIAPEIAGLLGLLALCLGLVAALAHLLAKFAWPVAVQSFVSLLIGIALPPTAAYTLLSIAMRYGHGAM